MKKQTIVILLVVIAILGLNVALMAQTSELDQEIELLRKDLRMERKVIILEYVELTNEEGLDFWPVFDKYAAELASIYDLRLALVKQYAQNYDNLTDELAAGLLKRSMVLDAELNKVRQKYVDEFMKVLPAAKAARFMQVDRRLGLLIEVQLASEIPLAKISK